jgi:hypothetical protein
MNLAAQRLQPQVTLQEYGLQGFAQLTQCLVGGVLHVVLRESL